MLILAVGSMCGVGIGLARGGRVSRLADVKLHLALLPCVALLIQATAGFLVPERRPLAIAASYGLLAVWLAVNLRRHHRALRCAVLLLTLGWLLNVVPMMLNRGMPVSLHAVSAVGGSASTSVTEGHLFKHVPAGRDTKFAALGDIVPVPGLRTVISIGDVLLVIGLSAILVSGMGSRASPRDVRGRGRSGQIG